MESPGIIRPRILLRWSLRLGRQNCQPPVFGFSRCGSPRTFWPKRFDSADFCVRVSGHGSDDEFVVRNGTVQHYSTHMVHGAGIYLPPWLGHFVRVNVGKYASTMVRIWGTLKTPQALVFLVFFHAILFHGYKRLVCGSPHGWVTLFQVAFWGTNWHCSRWHFLNWSTYFWLAKVTISEWIHGFCLAKHVSIDQ